MTPTPDGPSLATYVETRFNLLTEAIKDASASQASALGSSIEAMKQALAAADLRYQQRFDAQADALAAAFMSQQVAMKTALEAAKEAVNAALAAADRAGLKSETAADKRFEALNELRQMLNDMITSLMPRKETEERFVAITEKIDTTNARIGSLENRANMIAGETTGDRRSKDNTKAIISVGISIVLMLLALIGFIWSKVAQ